MLVIHSNDRQWQLIFVAMIAEAFDSLVQRVRRVVFSPGVESPGCTSRYQFAMVGEINDLKIH
jgi:hypothetical protein